jgi:hypothetical protein
MRPPADLCSYAICRTCFEVHPTGERCRGCDGQLAPPPAPPRAAIAGLEDAWFVPAEPARPARRSVALLGAAVLAGLVLLLAAVGAA